MSVTTNSPRHRSLPSGAIFSGKILQPEYVATKIEELVLQTQTQGSFVTLAVPATQIISKRIPLPTTLTAPEVEFEIESNIQQYLPGINEKMCFDFIMPAKNSALAGEALLVAARYELIKSYVDIVRNTSLKVQCVDVDAYAFVRAVSGSAIYRQESQVILHLEVNAGYLVVLHKNEIILNQEIMFNHTESDIPQEFCQRLKNSLQMIFSTHKTMRFKKIILSGEKIFLQKIIDFIQYELLLYAYYVNPSAFTERRWLVAYGLALRSAWM